MPKKDTTPRALSESAMADHLNDDPEWASVIYEGTRKKWMQYGAEHDGVWSDVKESRVRLLAIKAMKLKYSSGFSSSKLSGVMNILTTLRERTLRTPSREKIPYRNAVLDVSTRQTTPHSPDHDFTWCLPYDYDETATCEPILAWLRETVAEDKDTVELLRAYLRAILLRRVKTEKFLEIIGHGGSGKGTFLRLAQALVGSRNTHPSSLKFLEQSQFETVNLIDKQLVVITDEERYTGSVSTLKAITGEDSLRGERKGEQSFRFTNTCMVILAANEAIQSPDYSSGLARRRLSVHFRNHPARIRDLIHFDEAGNPHGELAPSLPGLLNWLLDMPEEEMDRRLRVLSSDALMETKAQILIETNPMAAWAQDHLILTEDPKGKTYVGMAQPLEKRQGFEDEDSRLYPSYCGYMQRANFKAVSMTRFSALLEDLCHDQLRLASVMKARDQHGVHLAGVRLRTDKDLDIGGFIHIAMASSLAVQANVDSMKGSRLESADYVDYVDFFKSDIQLPPSSQKHTHAGGFSEKPTHPTYSTLSRAQAVIKPSPPCTQRHDTDKCAKTGCDSVLARNQKTCFVCGTPRQAYITDDFGSNGAVP